MGRALRVLLVEDNPDDEVLMLHALRRGGFDPTIRRVETKEAMEQALREPWDVIISDYSLPRFSGIAAHKVLRATGLDVPFLMVSGKMPFLLYPNEDPLPPGIAEPVYKGYGMNIAPMVEQELRLVAERRARKQREVERAQG